MKISELMIRLFLRRHYKSFMNAMSNEKMNLLEIQDLQENKLRNLISFVLKNNDYYKELNIDNINNLNRLKDIPTLSKSQISENFSKLMSKTLPADRFISYSTSGSTSATTKFYIDAKLRNDGLGLRSDSWAGWNPGDPILYIWGAERDMNMSIRRLIKHSPLFYNIKILSAYYMSLENIREYAQFISKYKPKIIIGYPSTLEYFSLIIEKFKYDLYKPKAVITTGETIYESQRKIIEDTFACKVFNRYASREFDIIASECEVHDGLHIAEDHLIVEILKEDGSACGVGEIGELVITDLDNYVFPLIRYKIGDLGEFYFKTCSCGRKFKLIKMIEGRTFDLIVGINGNKVTGSFFTLLRNQVLGIRQFQIIQNQIDTLEIKLVVDDYFNDIEKNKMIKIIKEKLGYNMIINIQVVNLIPLTKTGKHRWIISNVSPFIN